MIAEYDEIIGPPLPPRVLRHPIPPFDPWEVVALLIVAGGLIGLLIASR